MDTAFRLVSWLGRQKEETKAIKIKSHANARKLAPFLEKKPTTAKRNCQKKHKKAKAKRLKKCQIGQKVLENP